MLIAMRKSLLAVAALFFLTYQAFAQEGDKGFAKLSPRTMMYMETIKNTDIKAQPLPDYVYKKTANGIYMSAVIKVNKNIVSLDLEALGVHVGTRAGNI